VTRSVLDLEPTTLAAISRLAEELTREGLDRHARDRVRVRLLGAITEELAHAAQQRALWKMRGGDR
jgi:hypothetical protein